MYQPYTPPNTSSLISTLRSQIQSGAITPQQAQQELQQAMPAPQYYETGSEIRTWRDSLANAQSQLFGGSLQVNSGGRVGTLNPDGSISLNNTQVNRTTVNRQGNYTTDTSYQTPNMDTNKQYLINAYKADLAAGKPVNLATYGLTQADINDSNTAPTSTISYGVREGQTPQYSDSFVAPANAANGATAKSLGQLVGELKTSITPMSNNQILQNIYNADKAAGLRTDYAGLTSEVSKALSAGNYGTITASGLKANETPVALPQTPTNNYNSITQGAIAGLNNPSTGITVDTNGNITVSPVNNEVQNRADNLKSLLGLIPKQENVLSSPEVTAQNTVIEQRQKELNDATSRLNAITKQGQVAMQTLESQAGGKGVTSAFLGREQQEISRQVAIQSLPITAEVAVLQGNLQLAQQHLDTLLKVKTEQITNDYNYRLATFNAIADFVTKEEKIRLDELKTQNERAFEIQRDNIKLQNEWSKVAIENGQAGLISQINSLNPASPNFTQSLGLITSRLSSVDAKYKQAQINKMNAEEKNISLIDNSQLLAYAQQYASTGNIPTGLPKGTFGLVSLLAKELPKSEGQILDKATGVTPDKLGAAGDAYGALYSAIELSKQLAELDKKRIGGLISGTLGKVFGSDAQSKYVDLRGQIVDLLSRARSGAALTVTEEKRYEGMLPSRFSNPLFLGTDSQTRIENFTNALTSDLVNKTNSKGWVVNGITPVKLGNQTYIVGDIIDVNGIRGRVNPDGTITQI